MVYYGFDTENIEVLEKQNEDDTQRYRVKQQDGSYFEFDLASLQQRIDNLDAKKGEFELLLIAVGELE